MIQTTPPQCLDRDLKQIDVGVRVRFIMRGYFHAREQESFGIVESIDPEGGIKIRLDHGYKHFLTSKRIGEIAESVYFTHHRYDREKHARIYSLTEGSHELFISLF